MLLERRAFWVTDDISKRQHAACIWLLVLLSVQEADIKEYRYRAGAEHLLSQFRLAGPKPPTRSSRTVVDNRRFDQGAWLPLAHHEELGRHDLETEAVRNLRETSRAGAELAKHTFAE